MLWITASQDFKTQRLQDAIGKELGLGILQEEDVRKRAAMLYDCLTKRGKSTIILDDVWERFDLKEVGIPDGIKLVLTTRSFEVCRQMQCQEMIKVEPLSHTEAESLFLEELGSEVALDSKTRTVVESIVQECAGLPLAIITMARSMRGVTDVYEWNECLEKLRESDMGQTDMEKVVLKKLGFSYNRLGNHEIQQCFLSCALYPEDERIDKFELIEFFIDQGLICRLNTREKQYVRGLTILNKLANVCLLEVHGSTMKMHDLIRDMALHIMSVTSIVKARKGLRRIPSEEYWTNAFKKINNLHYYNLKVGQQEFKDFDQVLRAINCDGTTNLSDVSLLENLEKLIIVKWKNLRVLSGGQDQEIIDICDSRALAPTPLLFPSLRVLIIRKCPKLKYLFGHGPKFYLPHLREIAIHDCEEMVGITSPPPQLAPDLPSLEEIYVWRCDKMKRVVESEWLPHFPNPRYINLLYCENMEEIIRGPPPYMPVEEISLGRLSVEKCYNMRKLFSHEWLLHLQNLQNISAIGCKGMVEMISGVGQDQEGSITTPVNNIPPSSWSSISLPKLKRLWLCNLPRLKSICEVPITCDSMEHLKVIKCPELNRIPLQLRFLDIEDLPFIEVEGSSAKKKFPYELLFFTSCTGGVLYGAVELGDVGRAGLNLGKGVRAVGAEDDFRRFVYIVEGSAAVESVDEKTPVASSTIPSIIS
ncbi:probable disease resistance protein At4g27220 [Eucalyptus grandis]|uniref:probable disease resistance protein At4g27220 n=1 Tax=Eucalyptus grandis TaxID=71139 RepID=UPI00192EDFF8|nr:probable disease resistance protein At4g27220 [Eucalyptus grandis]